VHRVRISTEASRVGWNWSVDWDEERKVGNEREAESWQVTVSGAVVRMHFRGGYSQTTMKGLGMRLNENKLFAEIDTAPSHQEALTAGTIYSRRRWGSHQFLEVQGCIDYDRACPPGLFWELFAFAYRF
jgi:hypothetical protein